MQAMIKEGLAPADMNLAYIGQTEDDDDETGYGITGLPAYLKVIPPTAFLRGIKHMALLVDNDMDAPKGPVSKYVTNELTEANKHEDVQDRYSVPTAAHTKATKKKIAVTTILLPGGNATGCLETLLVKVLNDLYPNQMKRVEQFLDAEVVAQPTPAFAPSKRDKARVRIAVAILNRSKPQMPLRSVFKHEPKLIPVTHKFFKPLAAELLKI